MRLDDLAAIASAEIRSRATRLSPPTPRRPMRRVSVAIASATLVLAGGAIAWAILPRAIESSTPTTLEPVGTTPPTGPQPTQTGDTMVDWPDPDQLGACPPGWESMDWVGPLGLVTERENWVEIDGLIDHGGPGPFRPVTMNIRTVLRGVAEPDAVMSAIVVDDVIAELARGARLIVGVDTSTDLGPVLSPAASVRPDGTTVFIGWCQKSSTAHLAMYAEELSTEWGVLVTPAEALLEVASDEAAMALLREWLLGPPSVPWIEQDPELRGIDPGGTPPEILATFDMVAVHVVLPDQLVTPDTIVCTRVPMGWNECWVTELVDQRALAYAQPGDDIEVWLMKYDDWERISLLATINSSLVASVLRDSPEDPVIHVRITVSTSGAIHADVSPG